VTDARRQRAAGDRVKVAAAGDAAPRNWFGDGGRAYARFRPEYPRRLAMFLAGLAPTVGLAVDVGCGSGQLTEQLALFFDSTIGLDPSEEQIRNTRPRDRIRYLRAPAENLPVPDRSAALITAAQAAHWFDRPAFYSEVRRIAVDNAVLALISYGVIRFEPALADRFDHFDNTEIGPFWPPERALVDSGYADIDFPFEPFPAPTMQITQQWTLGEALGYIATWSAVRRMRGIEESPVILRTFAADLADLWGNPTRTRPINWPINMKLGIV
jgi:SAM-dependent methyltransferase